MYYSSLRSNSRKGQSLFFTLFFILFAVLGLVMLSGCEALSAFAVKKTPTVVRAAQTNWVEVRRTNFVGVTTYLTNYVTVQAAVTNAATGAVTAAVIQPQLTPTNSLVPIVLTNLEPVILPAVVVTNLSLSPTIAGGVQLAGDVAPVPWASGAASLLVGVAGSVFGFINHRKAKKALGEKEDWKDTTLTAMSGFETLRETLKKLPFYTPQIDEQIMRVVVGAQYAAGVKENIDSLLPQVQTHPVPETVFAKADQDPQVVAVAARSGKPLNQADWSVRDWAIIQALTTGKV